MNKVLRSAAQKPKILTELEHCPSLHAVIEKVGAINQLNRQYTPHIASVRRVHAINHVILQLLGISVDIRKQDYNSRVVVRKLAEGYFPEGWASPCLDGLRNKQKHNIGVVLYTPIDKGWEEVDIRRGRVIVTREVRQTACLGRKLIVYCTKCRKGTQFHFERQTRQTIPWLDSERPRGRGRSWYPLQDIRLRNGRTV